MTVENIRYVFREPFTLNFYFLLLFKLLPVFLYYEKKGIQFFS